MTTATKRPRETSAQRAKREWDELMEVAVAAGYVNPYPEPGTMPVGDIEDRCEQCRWTLFVSMPGAVYCVNAKCTMHRHDLRDDVEDEPSGEVPPPVAPTVSIDVIDPKVMVTP